MSAARVFLLSPADCGGKRAALLFRPETVFDLALRLRTSGGAPLGEVFSFLSGLYFRGKITYARAFARPPVGWPGALVITAGRGLVPPEAPVTLEDIAEFGRVPVDLAEPRYRQPLEADVAQMAAAMPPSCDIVLLGSIATAKYVELLHGLLGARLRYPEPFVGMGDMARGALLLRAARAGVELPYAPISAPLVRRRVRGPAGAT